MMKLIITCLIVLSAFFGIGQEVKLGLPVGHTSGITSAVFSPDEKHILTSSHDGTACLWETNTSLLIKSFIGHSKSVNTAVFSPEGNTILTASDDKTFRIWNPITAEQVQIFEGHDDKVLSAVFSPNGNKILSVSKDTTAKLWDVLTGNLLFTFKGSFLVTKFVQDGNLILLADTTVRIYNISSGELVQSLNHHEWIASAECNQNGSALLTTTRHGKVRIWDLNTGLILKTLIDEKKGNPFSSASWSPDGKQIVTSSSGDKYISIWNFNSGNLFQEFEATYGLIKAFYSSSGEKIVTVKEDIFERKDMFIYVWNSKTGEKLNEIKVSGHWIRSAEFSKDGNKLLTSSAEVRIWDLLNQVCLNIFDGHTNQVYRSQYFWDKDREQFQFSTDSATFLLNLENGKTIGSLKFPTLGLEQITISPNGSSAITVHDYGCRSWDLKTGKQIHFLYSGDNRNFKSTYFSQDDQIVLTRSLDVINVFDQKSGELLKILKGHSGEIYYATISKDGTHVLTSSDDETVRLWSLKKGKTTQVLKHSSSVYYANFNSDESKILTYSIGDTVRIWDAFTGIEDYKFKISENFINQDIFITDEKHFLTSNSYNSCFYNIVDKVLENCYEGFISYDKHRLLKIMENLLGFCINDAQTGEQLIRHFIFDSDPNKWVHLHPSGLFDASPEAMELMYWTKGLEVIEFAQLKDRYWVPGLWEKVMKGETLPDVRGMNELKLQPEVEMGEVKDGKIPVTLTRREGGYGKVSVFINGKEVEADARGENFDKSKETQTIWVDLKDHPNLQDGENSIAVKASSEDGFVEGRPVEKKLTMKISKPKPNFYAVVIGTGKYTNSSINLKYPEKDAKSMSLSLKLGAEELFGADKTHIYTLTTEDTERPTKERIKSVFKEIEANATSTDIVLVYLSGHGIAWGGDQGDFYYITTDATAANSEAYNDEVLRKNHTISTAEFTEYLNAIPALKQVMIIDACSSGKAVENLMASRDVEVSQIKAIDRMKDRTGMFVISGSAADAVSYEASRYGQGLLTYSILQAMKGAALREDQYYDVNAILNYARETVPQLAAGIGGIQKPQLLIPKGGSFDIGLVNEDIKKQIPLSAEKPVFVRTTFIDVDEFSDVLNLSKMIDDQLNNASSKGVEAEYIFLDVREFPDAYRLSGGYTQSNGSISLKLKIKGPLEQEHVVTGITVDELLMKLMIILGELK